MDNKENRPIKNRSRGENWTKEEKDLFLEVMNQSASIIENKLTDTNSNKLKNLEWVKIQNKLKELTGKPRDITQLKGFWRRGKVAAKKAVSQHRRAVQATGGGQPPSSPRPDDQKIMSMCPTDFVVEDNKFDSDAVLIDQNDVDINMDTSTIYDTELDEDHDIDKYCEIVTIAEVHHSDENEPKKKIDGERDLKEIDDISSEAHRLNNIRVPKPTYAPNKKRNMKPKPNTSKAAIVEANTGFKKQTSKFMEDEHKFKCSTTRKS